MDIRLVTMLFKKLPKLSEKMLEKRITFVALVEMNFLLVLLIVLKMLFSED